MQLFVGSFFETLQKCLIFFKDLKDRCIIYVLLSQRIPEYPGRHVQRYPIDLLTTHDPLFKHGEDEQLSTEKVIEIRNSSHC